LGASLEGVSSDFIGLLGHLFWRKNRVRRADVCSNLARYMPVKSSPVRRLKPIGLKTVKEVLKCNLMMF
jgi:lauroyl/myristoyl acyltransferase